MISIRKLRQEYQSSRYFHNLMRAQNSNTFSSSVSSLTSQIEYRQSSVDEIFGLPLPYRRDDPQLWPYEEKNGNFSDSESLLQQSSEKIKANSRRNMLQQKESIQIRQNLHQKVQKIENKQKFHNFQKHLKKAINSILKQLQKNENLDQIQAKILNVFISSKANSKNFFSTFFGIKKYDFSRFSEISLTYGQSLSQKAHKSLKQKLLKYYFTIDKDLLLKKRRLDYNSKLWFLSYMQEFFSQIKNEKIIPRINLHQKRSSVQKKMNQD